jgi:hypothetical protein
MHDAAPIALTVEERLGYVMQALEQERASA